jgi:hypothetical protein
MKYLLSFLQLWLFIFQDTYGQNLTGTWEGVDGDYRIVLIQQADSCFGYTYDTGMGFCKANFVGTYNDSSKKLKGLNTNFIERTLSHGLSSYKLTYSMEGNREYLRGRAGPKQLITKILSLGLGTPIAYRKVSNNFDTTKLIAARLERKIPEEIVPDAQDSLLVVNEKIPGTIKTPDQEIQELSEQKEQRRSQLVNTISTSADSLRITLHDNGEIDNDTVTVFLNGKIIVNQLGLTAKAYETFIPLLEKNAVYSIELMANNLGSISPNTAYLTIWAGKEKYELRISSDYTVNARIDVLYKPED